MQGHLQRVRHRMIDAAAAAAAVAVGAAAVRECRGERVGPPEHKAARAGAALVEVRKGGGVVHARRLPTHGSAEAAAP